MIEQPNEGAPSAQGSEATKALATLQDAASLIEKYAIRTVGKETAQQFSTHLSVMAQRDDKFSRARPESVVAAMMACVELGLMPNTPQQYAHLIPYDVNRKTVVDGKEVWTKEIEIQFQIGYKGLLELANRTGQVKAVYAELVFDGDEFDVQLGTDRLIIHKPDFSVDRTDYSKVTHAYMVAMLANGERMFEVMNRSQLEKIRQSAKATSTDSPWNKWATEQARKTVIKRGVKLLPSSGEDNRLQYAATLDSWSEAGKLKFDNGHIIQGEMIEPEDAQTARVARIQAAENVRKGYDKSNFSPQALKPAEEAGSES